MIKIFFVLLIKYYVCCIFIVVLSGWEGENKYQIKNTLGQQVYFAAEGILLICYVSLVNVCFIDLLKCGELLFCFAAKT